MEIKICNYSKKYESSLMELFFKSTFGRREEYEYIKERGWVERYLRYDQPIIKLAMINEKVVGSLGILPHTISINRKNIQGGCFVDNCILPEHEERTSEIFEYLFREVEKEMKKQNKSFVWGWDYEKTASKYSQLIKNGYVIKKNINWISGGFEYKKNCPSKWRAGRQLQIIFIMLKLYNRLKSFQMTRNIDFQMRLMKKTDLSKVASMINDCYQGDLIIDYNKDYLEHSWDYGMRGIVAEKQNQIIGAIPFELASWSGWMFGKPGYDKDWERFYTIIPEEFAITPKYCDSDIPKKMASVLINIVKSNKDTVKTNGFVTDVFDQGIKWKREAYLKAGYLEPDIDLGMIVAKSLEPKIEFDKNKNWHIPTRNIVAPTK